MTKKVSLLHISDLHRSHGSEISNTALLSSLINDCEKYSKTETPRIRKPDIIVVSGDVIRGSTNPASSAVEISNQYKEADEFLEQLANHFVNGNKKRIVIIPGNHDIDWKFSRESMDKIDNSKVFDEKSNVKSELLKESINQNSSTRWSWKDISFYQITDVKKYDQRLEAFSQFYSGFYGSDRKYSLDPREQFDIFDYPEFNITIVAFNSCYQNDHLRLVGDIHPECIAKANLALKDYKKFGRLVLATWHHNTKGRPYDSNYMDSSRLKNFIDTGVSVGFHGHQHKTELIHEYSNVIEQKKIVVFSAGTLCGGPNELPTGNNRQYNVVEIEDNEEDESISLTLHIREKTETSSFENPIWTAGRIDSNNISHHTVSIERPEIADITFVLVEIERQISYQNYDDAKTALLNLSPKHPVVRKFLSECIMQTEDFKLAIKVFFEPQSEEEALILLNAAIQLKDKPLMKDLVKVANESFPGSPSVRELIKKIEAIIR